MNVTLEGKHVNIATAYRKISAQSSGKYINSDNISEIANYLSSSIRSIKNGL